MRTLMRLIIISIFMMVSAPAWSDGVRHIVTCDQDDEVTDDQVEAAATEWFKAVKEVKGGENFEMYLFFPVAAKAGEIDFTMTVVAPNFAEWGTFMDNYADSAAEDIDDKYEDDFDCGNGSLWEVVKIE